MVRDLPITLKGVIRDNDQDQTSSEITIDPTYFKINKIIQIQMKIISYHINKYLNLKYSYLPTIPLTIICSCNTYL